MILPTLKGPHVPAFVAAGDLAGTPYLVTEWIEGRTLADLVSAGPLNTADVARIGAALADALHGIHQQGVIHLNVKPENAIVRADGTVVLIDFGFAHHANYPDLLAEESASRRRLGAVRLAGADPRNAAQTGAAICLRWAWCCTSWRRGSCRSASPTPTCATGSGSTPAPSAIAPGMPP